MRLKINRKLKESYPWKTHFRNRISIAAKAIPIGCSVLDIGGGFCNLYKYIKTDRYISLDLDSYTNMTVKADFNAGVFPDFKYEFQILACLGILEYIDDPANFLEKIKKYGATMILTYRTGRTDLEKQKNGMEFSELEKIMVESGWMIIFKKPIGEKQMMFYCRKK